MGSAAYARANEAISRICGGGLGPRELRLEALAAIRRAVGFDAYAWLVTDPETTVGSSPLADVPCLPRLPELIRLKYLTAVNRWTALPGAVASLAGTTGGELSGSLIGRELLREYLVTDIASSVYRDRFGCWGFLDLWRTGAAPFTAAGDRVSVFARACGLSRRETELLDLHQDRDPQPPHPARPRSRHLTTEADFTRREPGGTGCPSRVGAGAYAETVSAVAEEPS